MSFNLTPEALQDISVRVVCKYMTKQSCLSEAIVKEAKDLELNPDQIKRVIEASNTIAYLRQLEDASDRTFEFPVAEYRDIMGRMVLPAQPSPVVEKTAAAISRDKTVVPNPLDEQAPETQINSSISEQEKVAMLVKETLRVKHTITKMAEDGFIMSMRLEKMASKISTDPKAFEKLSHVASEEDLNSLLVLCGLEKTSSTNSSVFVNSELTDVLSLNSLFKEARDMVMIQKQGEAFVKRATEVLIEKKAFSPIGSAVEFAGKGIGWVAGKAVQGGTNAVKGVGTGLAALAAGKTLSERVERVADIGGSAVSAPMIKHDNSVWNSIHGGN